MRRLGDRLGAIYTPVALTVAILAWGISGESIRFLAVLVIATPCPLLIGIPIAIIGSISLCARRAIIVKSPVVLEQIAECRTAIFDKTGTLTYGAPKLTEQLVAPGFSQKEVLTLVAGLEQQYPETWIGDAIKEAVSLNKRNWRYIARILEHWTTEGRDDGTHRGNLKKNTDPDKFIKGRYGHMVQR